MSEKNDIFEKYVKEKKNLSQFLKEFKTWVTIVTIVTVIIAIYAAYYFLVVERMSPEEMKASIELFDLEAKWVEADATVVGVKIVFTVRFKLKNVGKRALYYVTLEGIFEFEQMGKTHFDGVAQACRELLQPGETTEEIYIKSYHGYTASSKQAFIENKENWDKMNVKVFAKTSGFGLIPIIEKFPVEQVIEGVEDTETMVSPEEKAMLEKNTAQVAQAIQIISQESKWLDRKITTGKVIIVFSIKIKIKNLSQESLRDIVFRGVFYFLEDGKWLSDGLTQELKKPLLPGETSDEILIKAEHGYEGLSKVAFVKNRENWKNVNVKVLAKAMDSDYALIGTYLVSREIQGIKVRYHYVPK
ncbi:hypothetical protein ACFLRB_00780 [Acidobacteriota bacterium]